MEMFGSWWDLGGVWIDATVRLATPCGRHNIDVVVWLVIYLRRHVAFTEQFPAEGAAAKNTATKVWRRHSWHDK